VSEWRGWTRPRRTSPAHLPAGAVRARARADASSPGMQLRCFFVVLDFDPLGDDSDSFCCADDKYKPLINGKKLELKAVASVSACVQAFARRQTRDGDIRCERPETNLQPEREREREKTLPARYAASFGVYCFGVSQKKISPLMNSALSCCCIIS